MSNATREGANRPLPSKLVRIVLAFGVSCLLLAWLLGKLDLERALGSLRQVEPLWFGVAALCSVSLLLVRSLRIYFLCDRAPPSVALASVAIQVFLNRITPMRLGEFSLPYLLHKFGGEEGARSILRLVLIRLIDLLVVVAAVVLAFALRAGGEGGPGLLAPAAALAALAAILYTLRFWLRLAVRIARALLGRLVARIPALDRILGRLQDAAADDGVFGRRRIGVSLTSLGVFACQTALFSALLRAFEIRLSLPALLVGGAVAQAGAAIPVPSVGTIGPQEASWVAGYTWVGVSFDEAVLTAVVAQVVTLAFSAALALPAWLWLERRVPAPAAAPAAK